MEASTSASPVAPEERPAVLLVKNLDTGLAVPLDDATTPESVSVRTARSSLSPSPTAGSSAGKDAAPAGGSRSSGAPSSGARSGTHGIGAPSPIDYRAALPAQARAAPPQCTVLPDYFSPPHLPAPFDPRDSGVQQCLAYDEQVRRSMWQVAATPSSVLPVQLRSLVEREESTRAQAFQTALLEKQLAPYASLLSAIGDNLRRVVAREKIKPHRLASVLGYLDAIGQHRILALAAQEEPPSPPVPATRMAHEPPSTSLGVSVAAADVPLPPAPRSVRTRPPPAHFSAEASASGEALQLGYAGGVGEARVREAHARGVGELPRASGDASGADASGAELSGYYTTDGDGLSGYYTSDGDTSGKGALMREIMALAGQQGARADRPDGSCERPPTLSAEASALAVDSFNMPWAQEAPGVPVPTKEVHVVDEPPAELFRVRGPRYLQDRVKEAAQFHAMRLLGVDLIRSDELMANVCEGRGKAKLEALKKRHGEDIFLVNFQLPGKPGHLSLLLWYGLAHEAKTDEKFYPLWREFCTSDEDAFRNVRLKLMVIIPDGPFLLRKTVPGNKPVILGKGIRIDWFRGEGHLEANINISSSASAEKMWGLVQAVVQSLVVDLALIIEAKETHQLPERLLGAVRFMKVNLDEF